MMKVKWSLMELLLILSVTTLYAGNTKRSLKINYRGVYADESSNGIYNPERGFRLEVGMNVNTGTDVWDGAPIKIKLKSEKNYYATDSVSLVQSYFYLHEYIGRDIDPKGFAHMNTYFTFLRELGLKAVLRFAYETGWGADGPTRENLIRHTQQLKPLLETNKDVIAVVQAGMIGAWGEWHSSKHGLEGSNASKKNILEHILDMTPQERYLQIRVPEYKNLLADDTLAYQRLSFHDDMIIIKPHEWDGGMHEGTKAFAQIAKEAHHSPVDGELPWGSWSVSKAKEGPEAGWIIEGISTARQLFLEHLTSLSIVHNYKEKKGDQNDKYSMMHWKETLIQPDYLQKQGMPVSACYFQKKDGSMATRSTFDYIRDHLGYRLELQQLKWDAKPMKGKKASAELSLINRGFSTLFNEHPVFLVLINSQNKVYEFPTDADVNSFQPHDPNNTLTLTHKIQVQLSLKDIPTGTYRLGLWIPDGNDQLKYNNRYSIRCANGDVAWWTSPDARYGVNILTTITL